MRPTILVVEDNAADSELAAHYLEHLGFEVVVAASLEEAIPALDRVDAVLLDLVLPNGHGFQLLHRLMRDRNDIPVICHSAFPLAEEEIPPRPLTYWLDKPFAPEPFREVLGRAVEAGQLVGAVRGSVARLEAFLRRWPG